MDLAIHAATRLGRGLVVMSLRVHFAAGEAIPTGPGEFIPLLEQSERIGEVGAWVLEQACQQARRWYGDGHELRVAVNVSAKQLERGDFVACVERTLHDSGLPLDSENVAITAAISALAHSLDRETIAKGVETEAEQEFLRSLRCGLIQGFLHARPMPVEELARWMVARGHWAQVEP